jgi:hypothetical protein
MVEGLIAQLQWSPRDHEGRPLSYGVRRNRDGRQLNATETVGEVLENGEGIVLQPTVDAG